jgi:hypothetical protein
MKHNLSPSELTVMPNYTSSSMWLFAPLFVNKLKMLTGIQHCSYSYNGLFLNLISI